MGPDAPARPAFDAELVPVLAARTGLLPKLSTQTLAQIRHLTAQGPLGVEPADLTMGGAICLTERTVPSSDPGVDISVLILSPAVGHGPWPAMFHTHGGGMVMGNSRSQIEPFLPHVAAGAVLVSVDYRLAPEHPDPAPVEDCYAGLVWTAEHAAELDIDPGRIMIIGGSAGGGLAAGTALLARDRGFPHLTHQVLFYPMLDDRMESHSSQMLDGEGTWDRHDNLFGWTALLGERRGGTAVSPYAVPARATDLTRLPRTYIDVGDCDAFRDEAVEHALRLSQAGVSVDLHLWAGAYHGSEITAPDAEVSQQMTRVRDDYLRRALRPAADAGVSRPPGP
ncbi:alpha/beta hydrolase fold domain-containing protein [Ornithinimicrobium cryptoxanthini]|uniref:Alpha/beta hydrolase n=1 Tax=Ornithinimicrobium cryptoxanthini TaxID=2934161 RepID=A0ABY4YK28_9MICO|nr:alpha/beta hydrolase fold domain-containing protein [Ornithinimicrobium cryptoxanthini]USQ76982.1 alpha/beta hydrolase [Ornithinimicrobium cryptoxanthini]